MTTIPAIGGPSDAVLQDFASMSAVLTGFQSQFIRPALDPVNLSGTFYNFAVSQVGQAAMDALISAYNAISTQPDQTVANTLLEVTSPTPSAQAQLAQAIILMWYLGSWYPPAFQTQGQQQVISSQAYTKSLVWNVAQAHPMGLSAFTFGYWAQPPGSLDTFGVNTSGGGQ
jgi:acetyl-CoA acetyltransferase